MRSPQLAGSWLVGAGIGLMSLEVAHGNFGGLALPYLFVAAGCLLLTRSGQRPLRFPGTELERGLDRLLALLLPARAATTSATARAAAVEAIRLSVLRRGARRWGKELELIATDGYDTASRISARCESTGEQDNRALVAVAVRVLRAERAGAGADLTLANDAVSMIAYGLGARPAGADLTSLDDLLRDLGLEDEGDQLRTHFDDVVAARSSSASLHLRNGAQRSMFRELAGASFVLGAAARILELSSLPQPDDLSIRAVA